MRDINEKNVLNIPLLELVIFKWKEQLGHIYPNLRSNFGTHTRCDLLAAEGIASVSFLGVTMLLTNFHL